MEEHLKGLVEICSHSSPGGIYVHLDNPLIALSITGVTRDYLRGNNHAWIVTTPEAHQWLQHNFNVVTVDESRRSLDGSRNRKYLIRSHTKLYKTLGSQFFEHNPQRTTTVQSLVKAYKEHTAKMSSSILLDIKGWLT